MQSTLSCSDGYVARLTQPFQREIDGQDEGRKHSSLQSLDECTFPLIESKGIFILTQVAAHVVASVIPPQLTTSALCLAGSS